MRRLLIGIFLCVFAAGLIAFAPLELVTRLALPPGVSAQAFGSIWQGSLRGLQVGNSPALDLEISAKPSRLFTLAYAANISVEGRGVLASGRARMGIGGQLTAKDWQASVDLGQMPLQLPLIGSVNVAVSRAVATPGGRCISVDGTLASDMLQKSGEVLGGWQGPLLTGALGCSNGVVTATMRGETALDETITIDLQLARAISGSIRIKTDDLVLSRALQQTGFSAQDDGIWLLTIKKGQIS